jgi:ParB/RepB/Spo0J family partition protein
MSEVTEEKVTVDEEKAVKVVGKKKSKSKGKKRIIEMDSTILELEPEDIKKGWRARKDYGDITELAESIQEVGQMQPVVVKPSKKEPGKYFVIAGMRRTRACKQIGVKVKAVVIKPVDELHNLTMQLAENVKRKGFDKLEVADGLQRYRKKYEVAHPMTKVGAAGKGRPKTEDDADRFTLEAAKVLAVSEQSVRDLLKIADLPKDKKQEIEESATTTRERNVEARKALGEVRRQEKEEKQKQIAKEKHAKRKAEEKKSGKKPAKTVNLLHGKWEDHIDQIKEHVGGKVDLLLSDPPYERDKSSFTGNAEWLKQEIDDWDRLDVGWVVSFAELMANNSTMIVFCPIEAVGLYEAVIIDSGLQYKQALIWRKTNPVPAHRDGIYAPSAEAIVYAIKGKPFFKQFKNKGSKYAHSVFDGPICGGNERVGHPTQKPLWLIEKLIKRHSQKKDLVVDPFMGVGTTPVACKQLGRKCIGIEQNEKFVKRASLRLKAL